MEQGHLRVKQVERSVGVRAPEWNYNTSQDRIVERCGMQKHGE